MQKVGKLKQIKRFLKVSFFLVSLIFAGTLAQAQIPNLINFDRKKIHFGFIVGYNQMYYYLHRKAQPVYADTLYGINSFQAPGFQVGIVSDLLLWKFLNLRFTPGLIFSEKEINYYFKTQTEGATSLTSKKIESVYADIPLELKIRAKRWRDFRPYLILGARYNFDLASLRKLKDIDEEEKIIKLNPNDFQVTGGVGFDFYLTHFKFGIELKMSHGFTNLLKDAHNVYTDDLQRINSRIFNFTLTFE